VFSGAALGALALYADLPAGRRALARLAERILDDEFQGAFAIATLDEVSPGRLVAPGITLRDPPGRLALRRSSRAIPFRVSRLARRLLLEHGEVTLDFGTAQIDRAEGYVAFDPGSNIPTIAQAFTPRARPASAPSQPSAKRGVRVWFPKIEIAHLY